MGMPAAELKIPQNDNQDLASLIPDQNRENLRLERDDWKMFRSLETLPQKAGVPANMLMRLVLKELADNALDTGATVSISQKGSAYFVVEDDGPGISGEPEDIAYLFSIKRPMISSKLWRMPTRGALGNGLRVTAGAVLASGGILVVTTRNRRHVLSPRDDGSTGIESDAWNHSVGTRIEIGFGSAMPPDPAAMTWARLAVTMAHGETYNGKTSPFWYSADHFFEILQASDTKLVRAFVAELDGCSGAKAGIIAADYKAKPCAALDRDQAVALLGAARSHAKPVNAIRLGAIGDALSDGFGYYAIERGEVEIGARSPKALIPFVVEAWATYRDAKSSNGRMPFTLTVNRTPPTADVRAYREKKEISLYGCGLAHDFDADAGFYNILVNVLSPLIPITTDGKEPDLSPFAPEIIRVVGKAIRKAKRAIPKSIDRKRTQKDIVLDKLDEAVAKASGDGQFEFNIRQLYYVARDFVMKELEVGLTYGYFSGLITDFEAENDDIPGMHRDPRGIIYHPHTGDEVPLGTRNVTGYERPPWNFRNLLFVEKEGFFETLKAVKWPERYDCALMSSKGFSSRAAKDLIDMLAEDDVESLRVFCVHDADAEGGMIYQTLQEATRARGRRKIEIVNLGLEPWEGEAENLQPEDRDEKQKKSPPVADYVKAHPKGAFWAHWLLSRRYELNAMTMPQFIDWLDRKMAEHGVEKKVIPPTDVVKDTLREDAEFNLREAIKDEILSKSTLEKDVAAGMELMELPDEDEIEKELPQWLEDNPTEPWREWVSQVADDLSKTVAGGE